MVCRMEDHTGYCPPPLLHSRHLSLPPAQTYVSTETKGTIRHTDAHARTRTRAYAKAVGDTSNCNLRAAQGGESLGKS